MVDVSNKHKNITVEVSNKHKSFTVEVENKSGNTNITASSDTSQYWANQSHTFADQAKESVQEAKNYAELANSYIEGFENVVTNNTNNIIATGNDYINQITETKNAGIEEITTAKDEAVNSVTTARSEAIDNITTTKTTILQDIEFVADGEKEEIKDLADLIKENAEEIANRTSFAMFDTILKDHVLTYEESKGLALQGTYVYKTAIAGERWGYPDFYAKVVQEYNEATGAETVNGVTVKVHSNGHKFYDIANKTAIDGFFNTMGTAWFYGVDTENERVFLPRNNYFDQATGDVTQVGDSVQAGLPNITGEVIGNASVALMQNHGGGLNGAFYTNGTTGTTCGSGSGKSIKYLGFDASKSNAIYGKSNTVQPPAVKKLLYICVGNTVSDTSWVDVVTQVEGGVKDIEEATNEGLTALANASNALRTTQITNCITEIPQRIKYTLENGTLTIKAGSVVIVPYGNEDLTSQYPKGATFINDNFKVYDTQYEDGKFFVWAEIQNDTPCVCANNGSRVLFAGRDGKCYDSNLKYVISGSTPSKEEQDTRWYDTTANLIKESTGSEWVLAENYLSFPFAVATADANKIFTSIDQVFNGMGYIGSTVWVDKGVKGLIPNGRNADSTLNNKLIEFTGIYTRTFTTSSSSPIWFALSASGVGDFSKSNYIYNEKENKIQKLSTGEFQTPLILAGTYNRGENGVISNFQPKLPFRAVDWNDLTAWVDSNKSTITSWSSPDWSRKESKVLNTTYTADTGGYIVYTGKNSGSVAGTAYAYVNGVEVAKETHSSDNDEAHFYIPIAKGDTYKITDNHGSLHYYFVPMKGV